MISKPGARCAIEGHVQNGDETVPRRIEIDAESGLIEKIDEPRGDGKLVLDENHIILPGCIDFHVHAREDPSGSQNYKETFQSAGEAAIHGGVVAYVDMPNNPQPPVDDDSYQRKRALTTKSVADVLLYAGIGPGTRPLSFPVPYKAYMGPSVGQLFFENDETLREALAHYRGQWVSFHAESPEILRRNRDQPTHWERRPAEAEIEAVAVALRFSAEFGIHPHICHLSTAGGMNLIREARKKGFPATCEVAPQHLYFDLESLKTFPRAKFLQCNPPIRPPEDRECLLEAFANGEINFLATDHAPHSLEENECGISGIPHLDTYGPFLFWLREQAVSWTTIIRATSEAPGRALGKFLPNRYGRIEEGYVGSLTILDASEPRTVRRQGLRTAAQWSPFEGTTFGGGVSHTVVRGRVFPVPAS
jgi:dihydroorotase